MRRCRHSGRCFDNIEMLVYCDGRGTVTDSDDEPLHLCEHYEPMPDADALLALADKLTSVTREFPKADTVSLGCLEELGREIARLCGRGEGWA